MATVRNQVRIPVVRRSGSGQGRGHQLPADRPAGRWPAGCWPGRRRPVVGLVVGPVVGLGAVVGPVLGPVVGPVVPIGPDQNFGPEISRHFAAEGAQK